MQGKDCKERMQRSWWLPIPGPRETHDYRTDNVWVPYPPQSNDKNKTKKKKSQARVKSIVHVPFTTGSGYSGPSGPQVQVAFGGLPCSTPEWRRIKNQVKASQA